MTTHRSTILIVAGLLVLGSSGGAVAGGLITGKDIKNGSVTGKDIRNRSVQTKDLARGTVSRLKGATGEPGTTSITARPVLMSAAAGTTTYKFATCEPGEVATGGGFYWSSLPSSDMYVQDQAPTDFSGAVLTSAGVAVGWGAEVFNGTGAAKNGRVHVLCAATGVPLIEPRAGGSSAPSFNGR